MIIKEEISAELRLFIEENIQELNSEAAIQRFCDKIASVIENAIKSATITLPPNSVIVTGSLPTLTNGLPIVVNEGLS